MKTKQAAHTPGPWSYTMEKRRQYGQTIHLAHISPAGPDALFTIARLDPVTTPELAEANARLIAAAPALKEQRDALLEAAKEAAVQMGENLPEDCSPSAWKALDALRAAIAKAEGR